MVYASKLKCGYQYAIAEVSVIGHGKAGRAKKFRYYTELRADYDFVVDMIKSTTGGENIQPLSLPSHLNSADTQYSPSTPYSGMPHETLRRASMPLLLFKDRHGRTLLDIARAHHAVTFIAAIEARLQVHYFHFNFNVPCVFSLL